MLIKFNMESNFFLAHGASGSFLFSCNAKQSFPFHRLFSNDSQSPPPEVSTPPSLGVLGGCSCRQMMSSRSVFSFDLANDCLINPWLGFAVGTARNTTRNAFPTKASFGISAVSHGS